MKRIVFIIVFGILLSNSTILLAQTEPEELVTASDKFQDSYYDALKEKAIENYDKAIVHLEKCLKIEPENAVVYNELGKNYFFQKDYVNAETAYTKATQLDPKNKWYLIGLYDVYYETKNYNQAALVVQKIIPLDKAYREDLVSLYMYTQQFEKALVLINELEENSGKTEQRDRFKLQILSQTKNQLVGKNELESAIERTPLNEENYLSLIYLYSDSNQEEKALQVAKKLEQNIPESQWAQVFLFKYHINNNDGLSASKAMDIVFKGSKVDQKIKHRMFNEFLIFAQKNPVFETQLNTAITYFENDHEVNVYKELGKFYYKKKDWNLAIQNLERANKNNNNDVETNIFLLACYEEINNFELLQSKASELVDTFPNQPEYYYFAGKSCYLLKRYKTANDFLESGLEYVVENQDLEIDFLNQLALVSKELGNVKKSDEYLTRVNNLKNKTK
jgi:tetratricopeptide (TPR) repeat protein